MLALQLQSQLLTVLRAQIFTCSIGNLKPDEICTVRISYVTELKARANRLLTAC